MPQHNTRVIENVDLHCSLWRSLQLVVNEGPRGSRKTVCPTRCKETNRPLSCLACHLLEWRNVVKDVNASAVRRDHEVVKIFLYYRPRNRCMRKTSLEICPVTTIIQRIVESISCAGK